jgi:uncharacterized protein
MKDTGLSQQELSQIGAVLARHPGVTGAVLFGSRAKGTALPSSDIDLALEGVTDPLQVASIVAELDDLPMPYRFDVVALSAVKSSSLLEHIARVGVKVFG